MKIKFHRTPRASQLTLLVLLSTLNPQLSTALAQGTAFTYQGRLNTSGSPANGTYDFRFQLASDALGNNYVGGPVLSNALPVNGGLFTVTLDFGPGVFTGSNYWLEVDVKTNGTVSYTALTPLQSLTPSPYAIFAGTAGNLSGILPSGQLAGTYSSAVTFNNTGNQFTGAFSGNGANVTNVNAATLGGLGANQFWKTTGNSNTVAGANFLGTLDNQPLELRVGRLRALRLEPDPRPGPESANLIGGFTNNTIEQPGSGGDVIVGGGYDAGINIVHSNSSGVFIGAGSANQIGPNVNDSFIGAGFGNRIQGADSVIVGGIDNFIQGDSSAIGGGYLNTIQGALYSVIGGGFQNIIQAGGNQTTIAGGELNTIGANSQNATIGGGEANRIGNDNNSATISGGGGNTVQTNAFAATISGGFNNTIQPIAQYSTIGGGYNNTIQTNGTSSTIGGGSFNTIQPNASGSTISGGFTNFIQAGNVLSTIGGGSANTNYGFWGTIAGGYQNAISSGSYSTIGGGQGNTTGSGENATVSGGEFNHAVGFSTTVPGGLGNWAVGSYSMAAGFLAFANHDGAFVWADSIGANFFSTGVNQFLIRASGGVGINTNNPNGAALSVVGTVKVSGNQTVTGSVGIGTESPLRALQVGDSTIASSEGMIHLGSRSASGSSLRDWELGVPQTGDVVTGEGYSFVVRDTTASTSARLMIRWGTGNVGIGTSNPLHLLQVSANPSPAYCDGLSWVNGSDRNAKENFKSVDAREVLAKVAALPLSRWNYKADKSDEHLGPMAQDFHASFGLNGTDDKHIATVDEEGVALAAIQGLNEKVEARTEKAESQIQKLKTENAELERQNAMLEQRLETIEKIVLQKKSH